MKLINRVILIDWLATAAVWIFALLALYFMAQFIAWAIDRVAVVVS